MAAAGPTTVKVVGLGQGEAAESAAGAAATRICVAVAAPEAALGHLSRSSLSSHLRGSSLLSFFK